MEVASKMPKYSVRSIKDEEDSSGEEKAVVKQVKSSTVAIKSLVDAKINVTVSVTGNSYVFNGAGSQVDVDEADVNELLQKRRGGRSCCGGSKEGVPMFSLA